MVRVVVLVALLVSLAPAVAAAAAPSQPVGVVDDTFGRFDRDDLRPVGPTIEVGEPHTGPAFAPDGRRLALGVSSPGSPGVPGAGRVGLWIVDPATMTIAREVRTGIAAEAVVYPGVVAALLQDGDLVVVDPGRGRIVSRRSLGYPTCVPTPVIAAGRGIVVGRIGSRGTEVAVIEPGGRVRTVSVPMDTSGAGCQRVALVAAGRRAYLVGRDRIAVLDPATLLVTSHRIADVGARRSAAVVPDGLAVAGRTGLRLYDTATWRVRWSDAAARSVLTEGATVVVTGSGVRSLDARTGRVRWRHPGGATPGDTAVAAGRVYALPDVLDLLTGARVGAHPTVPNALRLVSASPSSK